MIARLNHKENSEENGDNKQKEKKKNGQKKKKQLRTINITSDTNGQYIKSQKLEKLLSK